MSAVCNNTYTQEMPMSKTHQYRKIMKPLLERRRRARINKCLDELKDLMVYALQTEGESIAKLEKADVLEITVKHLNKLKKQQQLRANAQMEMDKYRAGYAACATEVSRCLSVIPGSDPQMSSAIMNRLAMNFSAMDQHHHQQQQQPSIGAPLSINTVTSSTPSYLAPVQKHQLPLSPISDGGYNSGRDSSPSPTISVRSASPVKSEAVWRPF